MKNSISHFLAFILMIIFVATISFALGEKELRASSITKKLEAQNYYHKVYSTILTKIDDFVVNADVMQLYKDYLSVDIIKEDVNKIINNIYSSKTVQISRYNDFYNIIKKYSKDDVISKKYALGIDEIYNSNLFPIRELTLMNKLYLSSTDVLFILMVSSLLCLGISLALFVVNKNFRFHMIALLATSIILMLPNLFIKLFGIFDNFLYTNQYFTDILLSIVIDTVSNLWFAGIVIIILLITYKFIKENYKFVK